MVGACGFEPQTPTVVHARRSNGWGLDNICIKTGSLSMIINALCNFRSLEAVWTSFQTGPNVKEPDRPDLRKCLFWSHRCFRLSATSHIEFHVRPIPVVEVGRDRPLHAEQRWIRNL
jgi:hypothetical protein